MKHFIVIGNIFRKVRVEAITEGARRLGLEPLFFRVNKNNSLREMCDKHNVLFGVSVGMRSCDAYAKGFLLARGINTLILDLGYLSRAEGPTDEVGYNQLGINQLCWIPPIDLPDDRLKVHNVDIAPSVQDNKKLLVLGQVPADTQHGLSPGDLKAWLLRQVGMYAGLGYYIYYRPHPKASKFLSHYKDQVFDRVHTSKALSLEDNIREVGTVLTYNSTAGLTALMMGRRVVCSETAHFYKVQGPVEVYNHLCRVAYAQWTAAELRSGEALEFMSQFDKRFVGQDYAPFASKIAS